MHSAFSGTFSSCVTEGLPVLSKYFCSTWKLPSKKSPDKKISRWALRFPEGLFNHLKRLPKILLGRIFVCGEGDNKAFYTSLQWKLCPWVEWSCTPSLLLFVCDCTLGISILASPGFADGSCGSSLCSSRNPDTQSQNYNIVSPRDCHQPELTKRFQHLVVAKSSNYTIYFNKYYNTIIL